MKRILIALALSLVMLLPARPAQAAKLVFSAVTTNGVVDTSAGPASKVSFQIQSAAGSVCLVTIRQKLPGAVGWTTMLSYANPDANGKIYGGPGGGIIEVEISGYVSGTITVVGEGWAGTTQIF